MDCTFEELIYQYTQSQVCVDVRELEEAGLLKEFCDRVEKILQTTNGYLNHWEMLNKATHRYFRLSNLPWEEDAPEVFCVSVSNPPSNFIAHLIDCDIPPVDMEGLLAE